MADCLGLEPISAEDAEPASQQVRHSALKGWWPEPKSKAEYFACRGTIESKNGDLYVVARDPEPNLIFIHYHDNP